MCGIVGIYNFGNNKPVEKNVLTQMCNLIKHRGPDSEGYYVSQQTSFNGQQVGLGVRRLAIIDLQTGDQPIYNENRTVCIVADGEIYNFLQLRKELSKKHRFYTKSDTEVIVHLYEDFSENCVNYLRGIFTFVLWDEQHKQLFIAKDHLGGKPLYYTTINGSFIFASEIKSILEYLHYTPDTDLESIDLFLTYQYIPSPKTIFKNINSLLPAHTLTCDKKGNITIKRYWNLDFTKKVKLSFKEACKNIRRLLTEATEIRMISEVPLGAFLSGGHDSSIIVGLMSELSSKTVKTFAVGFQEQNFSELKYARIVAKHFKTEHYEFILKPQYIEILPKIVWYYGQPFADLSALPSYFIACETKKYITVALNGDGGDENFAGYLRYKALKGSLYLALPFQIAGKKITNIISSFIPYTKIKNIPKYVYRFISALSDKPEYRNILWHCLYTNDDKKKLYTEHMKEKLNNNAYEYLANIFKTAPASDIMDKAFYTDINTYLPECLLVKMDIATMANSLQARSPFLDHKILEFTATLPSNWKLHHLTTKYILKETFKDFLPKEILYRKKQGFGIPVDKWFRENWKDYFKEIVLSKRSLQRGYFKKESLEKIVNEHVAGKREHGYHLWALLVLELWHRVYIDKENIV